MGVVDNVRHDQFPKQGSHLGLTVNVCFNYDTEHTIKGMIVRDDIEAPWVEIIMLGDGKLILTSECQYELTEESVAAWKRRMATTNYE